MCFRDVPHPRTGATALHVASAKGYTQLMEMLIKAGADVNAEDKVDLFVDILF